MSHTFTQIIHSVIADISENIPKREPVLIYIGIGTFAGLLSFKNDDEGNPTQITFLEEKNYHQYPPFIRHLKQTVPNLHLYIILIDPMQENPLYLLGDREYTHDEFYEESSDKYTSFDGMIQINVLRRGVNITGAYDDRYQAESYIDIKNDLEMLNDFCMEQNVSMFYHDFTGRDVKPLAHFFDKQLGDHVEHVVYGFGARADFGCYFDLTAPYSSYPYILERMEHRHMLKFFNIYKYINIRKYYLLHTESQIYEKNHMGKKMILAQIDQFTNLIRDELRNYSLSVLRMIFRLINGLSADINEHFINRISISHREQMRDLYIKKDFHTLFETLIEYYGSDLDIYCKIKNFDLSGKEILQFIISNPNPYSWADNLTQFGIK